jgi:hypothetical protein
MVAVRTTSCCAAGALIFLAAVAHAAGDLSRQEPIEITVELGQPGQHAFVPNKLRFETGKLYKLVLRNPSNDPHYSLRTRSPSSSTRAKSRSCRAATAR